MADRFFRKTGAKRFRLAAFLLLSVLFHALLLFFKVDLTGDSGGEELVSIKYYDDSAFAQSSEKRLEEALPEKKKEEDELNKTGQIVDIAKPKIEKKPKKSKFLAEYGFRCRSEHHREGGASAEKACGEHSAEECRCRDRFSRSFR